MDAGAAPAPVTWRGPSLYTLHGQFTAGVVLMLPATWKESHAAAGMMATSQAGSTIQVWLDYQRSGEPAPAAGAIHYEHVVPMPDMGWIIGCEVRLVDADAALRDELTQQCAELRYQFEPDGRPLWKLEVVPAQVALAHLDTVTIRYTVTNTDDGPLDAKAYSLGWQLDGADSMALNNGFGNGGYESRWHHLPAGDAISDERVGFRDDLLDTPGTHVISLHHLDREVARATLTVTP